MRSTSTEAKAIFARLREILQEHSSNLVVKADRADYYCVEIPFSPKLKRAFPVAWVKISKSYVSYHFMPIYFAPVLQKTLSRGLKARMQGKSCFNFKTIDEKLFEELRQLTARGFEISAKANIV
jgi:hypothetical protein